MARDFNGHYHPLLLKQVPDGARTALDVGCGTGGFARLLARHGLDVDGVDRDAGVIEAARAAGSASGTDAGPDPGRGPRRNPEPGTGPSPRFRQADVRADQLPDGHYDFISCIASLHHMPFDTVLTLRKALAPGGVLAVLGLCPARTPADFVCAVPALALLTTQRLLHRRRPQAAVQVPMVWPPPMSYAQTRAEAARLLPGSTLRRLLWWRYLLVYRADGTNGPEREGRRGSP
ncbi:class I SAM-dependent methyltransferase [Streptomyces marispadix]|uniref:Class I SAM-dependent methyltransferase n=1 Tax=Streptomyces marispadix TaxID=2922868 RepID=A0ABS9STW6_9ACTN|nr:class I SAM-dependent methyltransferase [Streptomyces marispadix]MCH6159714.1 class I SAM-dependent methyltransferase [Streptomyces marispadix]